MGKGRPATERSPRLTAVSAPPTRGAAARTVGPRTPPRCQAAVSERLLQVQSSLGGAPPQAPGLREVPMPAATAGRGQHLPT